ncbi:MAG TPA: hypothetical protein PLH57_07755, partial [Oligoflexia bacterium]|nr:hypothetical protein [Oligoflexia bacterium]
ENQKMIEFNPRVRNDLQLSFEQFLATKILTDEDFTIQARTEVASRADALANQNLTETEAFQSQKRALRSRYEDNAIRGFYLKGTLRDTSKSVVQFLFDNTLVDDVFESDEALAGVVLSTLQNFDESKIAG